VRLRYLIAIRRHGAVRHRIGITDFGVAPPRRFAGLLRVRDRVTVHFDVALDQGGDVIDDLTCRLIERITTKDGIHASHF